MVRTGLFYFSRLGRPAWTPWITEIQNEFRAEQRTCHFHYRFTGAVEDGPAEKPRHIVDSSGFVCKVSLAVFNAQYLAPLIAFVPLILVPDDELQLISVPRDVFGFYVAVQAGLVQAVVSLPDAMPEFVELHVWMKPRVECLHHRKVSIPKESQVKSRPLTRTLTCFQLAWQSGASWGLRSQDQFGALGSGSHWRGLAESHVETISPFVVTENMIALVQELIRQISCGQNHQHMISDSPTVLLSPRGS